MIRSKDPGDLIQREIDGENSPGESAELQRQIDADPELRARAERLQGLSRSLASVGQEDAPPGIIGDVMRSIRAKSARITGGWIDDWRSAFARRPALGYALSLAAGIILGALGLGALDPSAYQIRDDRAVGTILPPGRLGSFRQVDRRELASPGVRGEAVISRGETTLQADLHFESNRSVQITLEFDANSFTPLGFGRSIPAEGSVVLEPGRVRFAHSGAGSYQVFLGLKGPASPPISVSVGGEGVEIEGSLETGGAHLAAN